jgi:hypothetical protein
VNFKLTAPCKNCPFRTDVDFRLRPERAREICDALLHDFSFACHKTVDYSAEDEDGYVPSEGEQHCAGALIFLEQMGRSTQLMRIAERIGSYDRTKLKMDAPVFKTKAAMINRMRQLERKGKRK